MTKRYVFVINGEVGPDLHFEPAGNPQREALAAALSSDPKVIEVDVESPVNVGWTWDGTEFHPPVV